MDKEFRYSSAPRSDLRYSINCIRMAIPPPPPLHQHSAPSSQTLLLGGGWDEELESVCKPESKGPERKSEGVQYLTVFHRCLGQLNSPIYTILVIILWFVRLNIKTKLLLLLSFVFIFTQIAKM